MAPLATFELPPPTAWYWTAAVNTSCTPPPTVLLSATLVSVRRVSSHATKANAFVDASAGDEAMSKLNPQVPYLRLTVRSVTRTLFAHVFPASEEEVQ